MVSYLDEMILSLRGRNFVNLCVTAFQAVARVDILVCLACFFPQLPVVVSDRQQHVFSNKGDLPADVMFSTSARCRPDLFLTMKPRQTNCRTNWTNSVLLSEAACLKALCAGGTRTDGQCLVLPTCKERVEFERPIIALDIHLWESMQRLKNALTRVIRGWSSLEHLPLLRYELRRISS